MDQEVDVVYSTLDSRRIDEQQISTVSRLLATDRLVLGTDVLGRSDRQTSHPSRHLNDIFMDAEIETIVTTVCPDITPDMMKSPHFLPMDVK